jgi:hypothetical protein
MFRFGDPGGRMYGVAGTSLANILAHWSDVQSNNVQNLSTSCSVLAGGGRVTGSCLSINQNVSQYLIKTLDAQASWGLAFAFKMIGTVDPTRAIAGFRDAGTTQMDIRTSGAVGQILVTRNGTTLAASNRSLALSGWNHIEFMTTINNTTGSFTLRINGSDDISATAQNTRATTNNSANQVFFGGLGGGGNAAVTYFYDDIIVYDGQANDAAANPDITGPIGDCGLTTLFPTGAGTTTQFTPDTGINYTRVNEGTPDGDTSYVESATLGAIDSYAVADLPASALVVKSIMLCHMARKTDVGARQLGALIRSGTTNYIHATGVDLGNNFVYSSRNWGRNPNGNVAWIPTTVNALEIGHRVNS